MENPAFLGASDVKVAIVTGANCGVGYEVTKRLCTKGYHVVMACRSRDKALKAIDLLKKKVKSASTEFMELDLTDLESVRQFAQDFSDKHQQLNVLINNAGMHYAFKHKERTLTRAGHEYTMASNHLGHFLLTHLLLSKLKFTAADKGQARIINITSALHDPEVATRELKLKAEPLDMDNFMLEKPGSYNGVQAYKDSKAANVLFTYGLSRRLEGTGVTVTAVNPGFLPSTNLKRHQGCMDKCIFSCCYDGICRFCCCFKVPSRTVHQGADDITMLATHDRYKGVTSKYFDEGDEKESSPETQVEATQERLWDISANLVNLEDEETKMVVAQQQAAANSRDMPNIVPLSQIEEGPDEEFVEE